MRLGSSSWPLAKWQSQKRMVNNGVQLAPNHRGLNAGKRLFSNTCEERDDGYAQEFWNTRLFLTKEFCEKIDKDFLPSARDYLQKVEAYTLDKTANTSQEREQLRDISRTFVTVLRPILRELESMIRSMMGND
jgi:hypothetical protein